jgi:hypothetical protein
LIPQGALSRTSLTGPVMRDAGRGCGLVGIGSELYARLSNTSYVNC